MEQARETGHALIGQGISTIVSSPFQRCVQTAGEIAAILDVPILLEWGLGEWLNPVWFPGPPRLVVSEKAASLHSKIDPAYASLVQPEFPETKVQMYERVALTARRLSRRGTGVELWVGHGASVQGAVAALLGVQASEADGVFSSIPCCCLTELSEDIGGWLMRRNCETSHLSQIADGDRFH